MSIDQQLALWNVIGTWFAGLATLAAVLVALYFAQRGERLRVKANAGIRLIIVGDGTPAEEHVQIGVVNHGDRTVTINSVGWKVGKGKDARFCIQPVSGTWTQDYPKQLAHGEQASFLASFKATPNWLTDFSKTFVKDVSQKNLKTLRALIYTSLGETIEVVPEPDLLKKLVAAAV